jgi:hypothetical protein
MHQLCRYMMLLPYLIDHHYYIYERDSFEDLNVTFIRAFANN